MNLIIDEISTEIMAEKSANKTTIVSICGAADLGKSYLSKEISKSLSKRSLSVNHLTLDSYLMNREIRREKKLSGYDIQAYNQVKALSDLIALSKSESIDFCPYNHKEGRASLKSLKVKCSDILIFDGLHSMHSSFLPYIDNTIFVYTDNEQLKKIRREADLTKRNYTFEFSNQISEEEFNAYKINVEPYKAKANYLLFLESKWNYKLIKTGYNTV